jgi:hypothetical protein
MTNPRIPTPAQVRTVPVSSVRVMRAGLKRIGLCVNPGGSHLRVTTAAGAFVGTLPLTPSCPHALLNCRAFIARRVAELSQPPSR